MKCINYFLDLIYYFLIIFIDNRDIYFTVVFMMTTINQFRNYLKEKLNYNK